MTSPRHLLLLHLLLISACSGSSEKRDADLSGNGSSQLGCEGLASFNPPNAERDARQALARGDTRLFGLWGEGMDVPALPEGAPLPAHDRLRMIVGTSDTPSVECGPLLAQASAYAERYNRVVLAERSGPPE